MTQDKISKKITIGLILSWVFGILFLLSGLTNLFIEPIPGLITLAVAGLILPPVNSFVKKKRNIYFSGRTKFFLVVLGLIIAGLTSSSFNINSQNNLGNTGGIENNKRIIEEEVEVKIEPEEIKEIDAIILRKAYEDNEIKADNLYKNKSYLISGTIEEIGKDLFDNPFISLGYDQYGFLGVQCMIKKSETIKAAELNKGEEIILQGRITGVLGNVQVKDCIIK